MKMETKGPPSHCGLPLRTSQQAYWLTDEDKTWDVGAQLEHPTAVRHSVNVCSNPRVKANKLFNKKLSWPKHAVFVSQTPESHCEGQCAAVVPAGTGSSCVKQSTPVAMDWTVGFVFIGGTWMCTPHLCVLAGLDA